MGDYEKLINEEINLLIEKKEGCVSEIIEIATYIDTREHNIDLTRLNISAINEIRRKIKVIYDLIEDLEVLKSRKELRKNGELEW